jgi:hypothetical protein
VALQAPSVSIAATATSAAKTRRTMLPRGDSFAMDLCMFHYLVHIGSYVFIASFADRSEEFSTSFLGPDAGELEEIRHGELPANRRYGRRRLPSRIQVQIRVGVLLQEADKNFGHDPPADRA